MPLSGWWVLGSMMRVTRSAEVRDWAIEQVRELSRAQSFGLGTLRSFQDAIAASLAAGECMQAAGFATQLEAFLDEGRNPTGSFKDQGMAVAVSMAAALGARALAVLSAGNAGGSVAAYGARAGLEVHVFVPEDAPRANWIEALRAGARVRLVPGYLQHCGALVAARAPAAGWFDSSPSSRDPRGSEPEEDRTRRS